MSTPLDLRNRKREAQRAVRLAANAVHAALDAWAAAVADGKRAATALTNACLTQLHLPALPLGVLADVPGLRLAAEGKLRAQQDAALSELAACLQRLQGAAAELAEAVAGLQQLQDREAEAPLLGESAVFAALPLRLLCAMLAEVHAQHAAELAVKRGVLDGFREIVGDLRQADRPGGSSNSSSYGATASRTGGSSAAKEGGGTGKAAAAQEERVRRRMQVLVMAWMLCAEVDEGRVQASLAAIAEDMRGF